MTRGFSWEDRRLYQRLDLDIAVICRIANPLIAKIVIGDIELPAVMLNLSPGGMAMVTQYNIPECTKLDLKFRLSRLGKDNNITLYDPVQIIGEVRSNVYLDKESYRLGICFTGISNKAKAELDKFFKIINT